MKYLAFIIAVIVLALSTAPCFMEDKCHEQAFQAGDQEQDRDDCGKECCSPFSSCKTCTGFVVASLHFAVLQLIKQPDKVIGRIIAPVSDFPCAIWHPPQLG